VSTKKYIEEDNDIDHYTREYVETMETCNKEEEVSKKLMSIFIPYKISTLYHKSSIFHTLKRLFPAKYSLFLILDYFGPYKNIRISLEAGHHFFNRIGRHTTSFLEPHAVTSLYILTVSRNINSKISKCHTLIFSALAFLYKLEDVTTFSFNSTILTLNEVFPFPSL